ncbi:hypothetical protein [Parapedobacter koreensis]|uniref:Uncharacterized protein n=1 Tax=Parapedobacter koreensis TaxID=332977 RepID=A0A1H7FJ63_9SPHI|nr:hypothetical protein [Parapedobacter koreensis]SEK24482.1 hypothetical protein SAMN05421740_101326 [Parapedobacter koreensis]
MDTIELIAYLKEKKSSFQGPVHIGGGATITVTEQFFKSHFGALEDPDMKPQHKELYVLRLQRFYDSIRN